VPTDHVPPVETSTEPLDEVDPGPDFWAGEVAWATHRFPELHGARFDADLGPLLDWIPKHKEVRLFINSTHMDLKCAPALTVRCDESQALCMTIPLATRMEGGRLIREFTTAEATGLEISVGSVSGRDRLTSTGRWETYDLHGMDDGGASVLGATLGPVTRDTAHFRYVKKRIYSTCAGPLVPLLPENYTILCTKCEQVSIDLASTIIPTTGISEFYNSKCPETFNSDLYRIQRLSDHYGVAFIPSDDLRGVALYRTLKACREDRLWNEEYGRP
jgi:hypothetical protein